MPDPVLVQVQFTVSGTPKAGAIVTLIAAAKPPLVPIRYTATSDAQGQGHLNLPPGNYAVQVTRAGRTTKQKNRVLVPKINTPVQLVVGAN